MKVSGTGAAVGALVGGVGRGVVVLLNLGPAGEHFAALMLPSAGIGLLVGAIAGATGRPLLGAVVGAVLSGVVFELFMCACASVIGAFSQKAGNDFLAQTLIYGLEMAMAGAAAGGIGGMVGGVSDLTRGPEQADGPTRDAGDRRGEPPGGAHTPSEGIQEIPAEPGAAADRSRD